MEQKTLTQIGVAVGFAAAIGAAISAWNGLASKDDMLDMARDVRHILDRLDAINIRLDAVHIRLDEAHGRITENAQGINALAAKREADRRP